MRTCRIRGVRRASPRLCRASPIRRARGIPMGSNTFYGAGLLLGSDAPQARIGCRLNPAGSARIYAPPMAAGRASPHLCAAIWRREVPYGKRRFIKRSSPVRAVDSVGSNTFYGAGGLREAAAPRARRGCRLSPADRVRFYARALWARGVLWEAMRFVCVSCVRMAPRRRHEEYAGSTRRASPHLCALAAYAAGGGPARVCAAPRQYGGRGGFLWEVTLYQEKFARQGSGF